MRDKTRLVFVLSASVMALSIGGSSLAQSHRVVEPIPQYKTLDSLPIEYTEAGVIKAQHIRPGDISPEEYALLLEEADRIRAYQSHQGAYTGISYENAVASHSAAAETASVQSDSSAYSIELYETSIVAPAPVTQASREVSTRHYVVKGDTLYNISKRFNVSVADLKQANNLTDNAIGLGQNLVIPSQTANLYSSVQNHSTQASAQVPASSAFYKNIQSVPAVSSNSENAIYAVLPKDTLYGISRRACVSVGALSEANGISDPSSLIPGQKLVMPSGHCL